MNNNLNIDNKNNKKLTHEEIIQKSFKIDKLNFRLPIYSILDNVRSMYNVGSIFRTSDATRIQKIILCGITAYPPRKEIEKTALGSTKSVPWEYKKNTIDAVKKLKEKNIPIIVIEHTKKSINYKKFPINFPVGLVFGHEILGIQDEIISISDFAIDIPMYGIKNSLNLSVSYGIILYEFLNSYINQNKNFYKLLH